MERSSEEVRAVLQRFQDGYTARDVSRLDEFMTLFAPDEDIELIGVGAAKRAAHEWFSGPPAIRDYLEMLRIAITVKDQKATIRCALPIDPVDFDFRSF